MQYRAPVRTYLLNRSIGHDLYPRVLHMLSRHQTRSWQKYWCEINGVQISHSAPGLESTTRPSCLPQVSHPPLFALCGRQFAVTLHLSRTPPPKRMERGEDGKKEGEIQNEGKGERERQRGMKTWGRQRKKNQVEIFKGRRGEDKRRDELMLKSD